MITTKIKKRWALVLLLIALSLLVTACAEDALTNPPVKAETLAAFKVEPTVVTGDPVNGERVFSRLPCLTCHNLNDVGRNDGTAPTLDHIGTTATTRLSGVNATQYLHHALTNPQDLTIPDYHKIMPSFSASASPQEINDLVSYLLSQR